MNKKMRVGIVGCGGIARAHAEAFKENGVQCVGLADSNAAAAKKFAAELGDAHKIYYEQFILMNNGFFLLRWLRTFFFYISEPKDIENLKQDIKETEKLVKELMPEKAET